MKVDEVLSVGASGSLALIGGKLILLSCHSPGGPAVRHELPLPPGGRILRGNHDGPTAVTASGEYWQWEPRGDGRWVSIASFNEAES